MHLDYANRPESGREAAFVSEWCAELGIVCRVRVVNEVTRGITDRDEYEKTARTIRYSFYQHCLTQELPLDSEGKGVIFGHHQGDVQENVISNVMR
jgi:tRNA(Ile)-lysidine synthase TilS/MesJ